MRVYLDTEFIEDGKTIELLSIGLVREDGETYYAEPSETDHSRASAWVKANVLPYLTGPKKPRKTIADEIRSFVGTNPEFWAYFADYDWVVLCQLYGTMMDLPVNWPMFCRDLQQKIAEGGYNGVQLPAQEGVLHNALEDAKWVRDTHKFLCMLDQMADAGVSR